VGPAFGRATPVATPAISAISALKNPPWASRPAAKRPSWFWPRLG